MRLRTLAMPGYRLFSLAFDAEGGRLAGGSIDNTVFLWEVPSGTLLAELRLAEAPEEASRTATANQTRHLDD